MRLSNQPRTPALTCLNPNLNPSLSTPTLTLTQALTPTSQCPLPRVGRRPVTESAEHARYIEQNCPRQAGQHGCRHQNGLGNLDWIFDLSLTTETGTSRHSTRVLDKEPTGRTLQKTMLNRSKTMRKLPRTPWRLRLLWCRKRSRPP